MTNYKTTSHLLDELGLDNQLLESPPVQA